MNAGSRSIQIPGYTLIKKINTGGMARVFLATQHSVGRTVALKIMKPSLDRDPEFHQRFQREARIVGQLSHPHIVPIYDVGRHEGLNYISMEFLPGGSLDEKIKQGLGLAQALKILLGIAAALEHAHAKGYVHRDIKSENILFRDDGSPVLTDFGIARTIKSNHSMTQTGLIIGTPSYMSPEQARGQPTDARSDLYSLGIVFYEMLTGQLPFQAETAVALGIKHIRETPPPLPLDLLVLQPILDRLLAKTPDARYQSARELMDALLPVIAADAAESAGGAQSESLSWFRAMLYKADKKAARAMQHFFAALESARRRSHQETLVVTQPGLDENLVATRISSVTESKGPSVSGRPRHWWLAGAAAVGALFLMALFITDRPLSAREQWAQTVAGSAAAAPALLPLTVNPLPPEARVRILNIREKYSPGMELPAGAYQLEISHPGYVTRKKWIRLNTSSSEIDIALQKENQTVSADEMPMPELVLVKAGQFVMGNPADAAAAARRVDIPNDFYMSRYEITFNEYDFFAVATNRALPDDKGWGRGERPVINISWDDAFAYATWLSKTTGKVFRLPTAEEWEYAARGNTTSRFWWGNNPADAQGRANCASGCKNVWDRWTSHKTQVVGAYPPNDFGLQDTAGNVAEWVSDCADTTLQPACLKRWTRGGSYASDAEHVAAYTQRALAADRGRATLGMRLVQELPATIHVEPEARPRRRNIFREIFSENPFRRDR